MKVKKVVILQKVLITEILYAFILVKEEYDKTYFKLRLLSSNDDRYDRQTVLTLLKVQFQLDIIGTPQSALVDLLVHIVVVSVLLDGRPGVGSDSLLHYYVKSVYPPLFNILGEGYSGVQVTVFSGMKLVV